MTYVSFLLQILYRVCYGMNMSYNYFIKLLNGCHFSEATFYTAEI